MPELAHEDAPRRAIRLLPPDLANRIAAGEVVERPASVVKELCENALDADAHVLEIDIEGGGIKLLRVRDDGFGIPPDEAPLALERHATSKIHVAADLDAIGTLGFRGEALPSIAAVSRFTLQTRARGSDVGTRVDVVGGGPAEVTTVGCPVGTMVEVRELFFNVPARRKFLRTAQTEVGHAVEAASRLALAYPHVDFRVRVDGRESVHAPPARGADAVLARAAQVLSREVTRHLYACEGQEGAIVVRGLVGDPGHARGRPDGIYTFVNGRFTRDRVMQHAVQAAYLPVLERGRYPWVVLFVEIPPDMVDVNVHPAKTEVRFSDSRPVHRAVEHIVAQALQRAPWVEGGRRYVLTPAANPAAGTPAPISPDKSTRPVWPGMGGLAAHVAALNEARASYRPAGSDASDQSPGEAGESRASSAPPSPETDFSGLLESEPAGSQSASRDDADLFASRDGTAAARATLGLPRSFSNLRVIGQAHLLYLVCEGPDEIVLIDQHAAHERVQFERLRTAFLHGAVASQALLFPATLEVSPLEREAAEAYGPELLRMGFELEPFGAATVALKAAPTILRPADATRVAADLLGDLARVGRASALDAQVDALLATVACHSAVRAGDALSVKEAEALLQALDGVDFRGNCPHGRPVVMRTRIADLERGFGRR